MHDYSSKSEIVQNDEWKCAYNDYWAIMLLLSVDSEQINKAK